MLNINVRTYEELEHWLRTEKTQMYNEMVNEIEHCWENGLGVAKIARANLDNGTKVRIDLGEDEFVFTLDKCLEYFEEVEMYESCSRVIKIKEEIDAGS
jgi:hypothetical protein